jgi:hypothetical protein
MIALLATATLAILVDALAYLALVVPGRVPEANPLVATLDVAAALWARAAVVVLLISLTVLAAIVPVRRLRVTVGAALVVAVVVGALGAASTVVATF